MRRVTSLAIVLSLVTAGIVALLLDSEVSGTGAENVGESGPEHTDASRTCEATDSNPGGTNNYIPDAPARTSLGSGFEVEFTYTLEIAFCVTIFRSKQTELYRNTEEPTGIENISGIDFAIGCRGGNPFVAGSKEERIS